MPRGQYDRSLAKSERVAEKLTKTPKAETPTKRKYTKKAKSVTPTNYLEALTQPGATSYFWNSIPIDSLLSVLNTLENGIKTHEGGAIRAQLLSLITVNLERLEKLIAAQMARQLPEKKEEEKTVGLLVVEKAPPITNGRTTTLSPIAFNPPAPPAP